MQQIKHALRSIIPGLCSLILALMLTACNIGGSSSNSPTPTPTVPAKPSPSPTPSSTTSSLTTYTGDGYSIGYPQGWKVANTSSNTVSFTDTTGIYNLTIAVSPDPGGTVSADMLADGGVNAAKSRLTNPQTESIASTTTVGGDTWSQRSESGDTTINGQNTTVKFVIIADVRPANSPSSRGYVIVYGTGKALFDAANTTYFQPMLQSFKFI